MKKPLKLLVIAVAAVLLLTVGLTATTFAWGSSGGGGEGDKFPTETFVSKVADILALEEGQVAEAFEEARGDMREEAMQKRLQAAIEKGLITQEEADEISEWWQNRPEAMEQFGSRVRLHLRNLWHHRQQFCRPPGKWGLVRVLDERVVGTVTAVSQEESAITVVTGDGDAVTFEYTSNTVFCLRGVTAIEEGQKIVAGCWEDVDGNLTAKVVRVALPLEEDVE